MELSWQSGGVTLVPLHGVGGQEDLLLPFWLTLLVSGSVIAVSFLVLARHRVPRPARAPLALPSILDRITAWRAWPVLWRTLGLTVTGWTALAAWAGPDDALNPTALVVYVVLWVLVVAVGSALLGPVYPAVDPIRTLWLVLTRITRINPARGLLGQLPERIGLWPAAAGLTAFGWLELAAPANDSTVTLRAFFGALWLIHLVGLTLFGTTWLDRADPFTVASRVYGHLAPVYRDAVRGLLLQSPWRRVEAMPVPRGLAAVTIVLLGTTLWDGLRHVIVGGAWVSTAGLLGSIAVLGAAYHLTTTTAMRTARRTDAPDPSPALADAIAVSLVPIALGYVIAHYWSFLIVGTQQAVLRSSDPFGVGDDLLGISDWSLSLTLVQAGLVATIKVAAVVLGHVGGVVIAHRRARTLLAPERLTRSQIPLALLMLAITIGGLVLLFPE